VNVGDDSRANEVLPNAISNAVATDPTGDALRLLLELAPAEVRRA
jgi:hypothetical protein